MQPLISVLVPVYNVAEWLPRCLDSICAQTYSNLEILCVNDGSTDNSAGILAEYAARDARIKVFTQENAGLSAARNTGLEHATGEWVTGVDSDDYLELDAFERAVACVADEVDVVAFGVVKKWTGDVHKTMIFQQFESNQVLPVTVDLAERIHVCFWNKLWRRAIVQEHGIRFPHGLVHEDDAFFYLFLPHARKIALCDCIGYNYMQREGSIIYSGQSELETSLRYMKVMRYVYDVCRGKGVDPVQSPWYQLFVRRNYAYRISCLSGVQKADYVSQFHDMMLEQGMLPTHEADYRFRWMIPVTGWRRLFLQRRTHDERWCLFGIPFWCFEYQQGRCIRSRFILFVVIRNKMRKWLHINTNE